MAAIDRIDRSRPVRVFRNWKRRCYSIMQDGALCASAREISLHDVSFVVRETGRQRMLKGQPKNVHAYAVGFLLDHVHPDDPPRLEPFEGELAFYDPFRFGHFVDAGSLQPVLQAEQVRLDQRGIVYRAWQDLAAAA